MDEVIERFAIRCAKGNNGGEWATHYTEDQKNFWRDFVRDLVADLATDLKKQIRHLEVKLTEACIDLLVIEQTSTKSHRDRSTKTTRPSSRLLG